MGIKRIMRGAGSVSNTGLPNSKQVNMERDMFRWGLLV